MNKIDKGFADVVGTTFRVSFLALGFLAVSGVYAASVQLYVSPFGNDEWSGTRPDPAWHRQDGPLKTLHGAANAVRKLLVQNRGSDIDIIVREGIYRLDRPLVFGPEDSGTQDAPIRWRAYPGEQPVISGAATVKHWRRIAGNIYEANLGQEGYTGPTVKSFFYKMELQTLSRAPNADPAHPWSGGFAYVTGSEIGDDGIWLAYNPFRMDTSGWHAYGARMHLWAGAGDVHEILPVKKIDSERGRILIPVPENGPVEIGNRFYLDNIRDALDAPGEWFYNQEDRLLSFIPPDAGPIRRDASVPLCESVIKFAGSGGPVDTVSYVSFEGFVIAEAEEVLVDMAGAAYCGVLRSVLTGAGGTGIALRDGSHHNRVAGCDIFGVGGEAVGLTSVRDWSYRQTDAMSCNVITNCHVYQVGRARGTAAAIALYPSRGGNTSHRNLISHNRVHDVPGAGIQLCGFDNICEYNNVFFTNQSRARSGGIVVASEDIREKGCIIRGNLVHHTGGYAMKTPGLWEYPVATAAVYFTPGSSNVEVVGNGFAYTPEGGVELNGSQNVSIEGNVFIGGANQQVLVASVTAGPEERHPENPDRSVWTSSGVRLSHNVFHFDGSKAFWLTGCDWRKVLSESDSNVVWAGDSPIRIAGAGMDGLEDAFFDWTGFGFDVRSVEADPLLTNPETGDFKIKSQSIALKLGFEPLRTDEIGLYESEERASWPPCMGDLRERHITRPGQ